MSEQQTESPAPFWFSTYGYITVNRVLERYDIRLTKQQLHDVLQHGSNFYHRLLRVPLRNIYNGIILQQAHDYQVYVQKLFIDYLVSGEGSKPDESPGAGIREDLEALRLRLIGLNEWMDEKRFFQDTLIAESQAQQIQRAIDWKNEVKIRVKNIRKHLLSLDVSVSLDKVAKAVDSLLVKYGVDDLVERRKPVFWTEADRILNLTMDEATQSVIIDELTSLNGFINAIESNSQDYLTRINALTDDLKQLRTDFFNLTVRASELITQLPEYYPDAAKTEGNREDLLFDMDFEGEG